MRYVPPSCHSIRLFAEMSDSVLERSSTTITSVRPSTWRIGVENDGRKIESHSGLVGLNPAAATQNVLGDFLISPCELNEVVFLTKEDVAVSRPPGMAGKPQASQAIQKISLVIIHIEFGIAYQCAHEGSHRCTLAVVTDARIKFRTEECGESEPT